MYITNMLNIDFGMRKYLIKFDKVSYNKSSFYLQ